MKIVKKISIILVIIAMMSCISFASEANNIKYDANEQGYTNIIIKGKDNIKAYEDAGLIKKCNTTSTENMKIPNTVKGTSIPTIAYNLSRGGRSFSYSFSNYIYSNYIYSPAPDSNSSTGF